MFYESEVFLVPELHIDLLCCCQSTVKWISHNSLYTDDAVVHASRNGLNQLS
jgi:hypothetical protein